MEYSDYNDLGYFSEGSGETDFIEEKIDEPYHYHNKYYQMNYCTKFYYTVMLILFLIYVKLKS